MGLTTRVQDPGSVEVAVSPCRVAVPLPLLVLVLDENIKERTHLDAPMAMTDNPPRAHMTDNPTEGPERTQTPRFRYPSLKEEERLEEAGADELK
jgi:hypothetical protein